MVEAGMVEAGMVELEHSVAQLYSAYVAELGEAIEQLEPWWRRLEAVHGRKLLRARWPAGVASHPRILAIYRDYHEGLSAALRPTPSGPAPRFDDDEAWGSDPEAAPESLIPIAPERLLIDRLQVEAPKLYAAMIYLLMSPVGVAPDPKPSLRSLEVIEPDIRRAQAFHFAGRHGTVRGIERLLGAAEDLRGSALVPQRLAEVSEFHRLAHFAYLRDLERALVEAERGWTEDGDAIGPVAHPKVLGVIQAYWALCEEINAVLGTTAEPVAPEQLVLDWLRDGRHASWVDALAALPYWPIGLDDQGRWI